ncbi:T9SS type A sorting domain-containing protein [Adhaeribacter soli]|uniref:T9SS type A sorting domain-containing protein n=1 Tax=Adhaeribacter soli TaxID=2607655 RepID=A0A5N1IXC5_9BACT|nr:YCF48-related protein [Adhaeribacter soli]KAA9338990.1 T9SS type A sorting domain-containing protein [Adhaeribacter soli]
MKNYLPNLNLVSRTVGLLGAGILLLFNPGKVAAQQCDRVVAVNGQKASEYLYSVDFTDPNTGITVGSAGVIMTTTDGGTNWTNRNSGTREALYDLHMLSGQLAYAVGGNGTVVKTVDGGLNWIKLPAFTSNFLRSVRFTHPDTGVVVGTNGTIFRTTNGGASWASVSSGVSSTAFLQEVVFPSSRIGYIVGTNGLLLKTTNGGLNWAPVGPATTYQYTSIAALSTTHIVMGRDDTNLLASSIDGGNTLNAEYLNIVGARVNRMHLLSNNIGYAVGNNARIYRRAGGSWSVLNNTIGSFYDIKFVSPTVGYAVGYGIIYKTSNGGSTWVHQNAVPDNAYRSLFFLNRSTGYMAGTAGKLHKTTDGGQTITTTTLSTTANLEAVCFTSPIIGFVSTNNTIFQTINGGTTWTSSAIPGGFLYTGGNFQFPTATTGYLGVSVNVSGQGTLAKTTNGGTTWTLLAQRFSGTTQDVRFISADTGFVATSGSSTGYIYRTTNGGQNWTQVLASTTSPVTSLAFANATTGVAIAGSNTSTSTAWRTTDAGVTWQPIIFPASQGNFGMRQITKTGTNTLLITGTYGSMLKSTDGGATWTHLEKITEAFLSHGVRADDSTSFIISSTRPLLLKYTTRNAINAPSITRNGSVLSSSAGYNNQWFLNGTPIPGATGQSFWAQQNGTYTVQLSQGTCTSPMSAPFIMTMAGFKEQDAPQLELSLYPNPAKNYLIITFNKTAGFQEITLSDIQGRAIRKVKTLNKNQIELDLKGLPAGVYVISASSGTAIAHRKVILN